MAQRGDIIFLAVACALLAGVLTARFTIGRDPNERTLSWNLFTGRVAVWTDPASGCEYLRAERRLTPRLDAAGRAICRRRA